MQSAIGLLRPLWRCTARTQSPKNGSARAALLGPGARETNAAAAEQERPTQAGIGESERAAQFERVMLPLLDDAYNLAQWLTRNREDAEDVVQDAYLRAIRFFEADRIINARAWLLSIVRNTFYDSLAKKRGHIEVLTSQACPSAGPTAEVELWDPGQDTPETEAMRRTEAEAIRSLVKALPEKYREMLVLREMEELSYREIAEITGIPIGTVMSRLARARDLLAAAWKRFEERGS